jgi:hypothetical protein
MAKYIFEGNDPVKIPNSRKSDTSQIEPSKADVAMTRQVYDDRHLSGFGMLQAAAKMTSHLFSRYVSYDNQTIAVTGCEVCSELTPGVHTNCCERRDNTGVVACQNPDIRNMTYVFSMGNGTFRQEKGEQSPPPPVVSELRKRKMRDMQEDRRLSLKEMFRGIVQEVKQGEVV